MDKNYKTLVDLTAGQIDTDKISNSRLKEIIKDCIARDNKFIFGRSGHTDQHDDNGGNNEGNYQDRYDCWGGNGYSAHIDSHTDKYTDHKDHIDYSEAHHSETRYSEERHHSDSYARNRDYNENVHTDK